MYSSAGASNKPSWAFDVADGSPRSRATMQNYRIPYPRSPFDENAPGQKFLCAKGFLVLVNVLFFFVGLIAIITSVAVAARPDRCEMCHSILNSLVIFGLVTSFIAALGIYGALSNSHKTLLLYVTLVAFLFMVQMVVFFWSLFGRANFQRRMHTVFREKMRQKPHELTELLNLVQQRLPCCGVDGPLDYHLAGLQLPLSCCSSSSGDQCTVQTQPPTSSTPLPMENTTSTTANITSNTTTTQTAPVKPTTVAPLKALLDQRQLPKGGPSTSQEGSTSSKAKETSTEIGIKSTKADKSSTRAGKTSTIANKASTRVKKTSTLANKASTRVKKTLTMANKISTNTEKTSATQERTSHRADKIPTKVTETSSEAGETVTETDEGLSETEETPEAEQTSDEEVEESTGRRKRSVTEPTGISPGLTAVIAGPNGQPPANDTLLPANATEVLNGNFSINITSEAVLEELLSNRTNLTGGPEPWDIHHVKTRGCYSVLWAAAGRHHGGTVAVTLAVAALLGLQLLLLCTAHRVARGDFIQRA